MIRVGYSAQVLRRVLYVGAVSLWPGHAPAMDAGAVAATTPEVAEQAPETTSEPEAPVPASDPSRQTAQSTSELETGDAYAFLQQQIYRAESDAAERDLQTVVVQIEGLYHRYHEDLVVPLTLLGDAAMVQGETSEALERYERARHIARVSYGLFDPRQMPVLYRESAALTRLGRLRAAGEREEQAYEVARRVYDEYDPELLPALFRLADFYLETYNYLAARALYNRAYAIHEANHTDGTDQAIPALQGIARSHRLERFPPVYVHNSADNRLQGPTPGLTNDDLESQHLTFNNFPAGEKALQRIVEIRRNTTEPDPKATRDAIMELADWHLMFGRSNAANTLYVHVFEEMQKAGEDPLPLFNQPQMIYLPKPHDPKPPPPGQRESQTQGYVKLSFTISPTGRVRNLQTVESQPKDLMDFRVRRSMRLAVFRPRIAGGEPIGSDDQQFTYEFAYFPEPGSAAAHATDSEAPAETEVDTNDA